MRAALIVAGAAMIVALLLLIATAVTGSWVLAGITAATGIIAVVGAVVLALRIMQRYVGAGDSTATRLANLEKRAAQQAAEASERADSVERLAAIYETVPSELARLRETTQNAWRLSTESALRLGRRPRSFLTVQQATDLFEHYLEQDRLLEIGPLIQHYDLLKRLDLGTLRKLYRFYRAAGYWNLGARTLTQVAEKSGRDSDRKAVTKLQREIALFSRPTHVRPELPRAHAYDPAGPILHMVGKVLPETQSGYTLRTHYTAQAQSARGLPVAVVGQTGITDDPVEEITRYTHQGVDYHLLPGPARGDALVDEWLRTNILQLAELARQLRPSVLHAHSDFHNALIVHAVGAAYGIPTVYETRGFWEESWLTRAISTHGWGRNTEHLFATYGRPAAYELRKHAEEVARTLPDHNFTLAEVMREHILDAADRPVVEGHVTVVPNAVDAEEFPVQDRDPALAARLGLPDDAVTIGYISSMVEYEGIDTLIDGFAMAAGRASQPVYLLLVGDGSHLPALQQHARRAGVENIVFTGAVPHEDVLRYYGLIDIFVVPRKKSAVADLVTPLKPYEAFATGRAVVLSDVDALQEIADQSGAAETFRAGYHRDLGWKLVGLVRDPGKRRDLGARAARWVRSHRTWDRNVTEYYRVYRDLGYRGTADRRLDADLARRAQVEASAPLLDQRENTGRRARSGAGTSATEDGPGHPGATTEVNPARAIVPVEPADVPAGPDRPLRVVVVAMKPQIAGRIRRNILTFLELGAEVIVVNTTPRDDFFRGLEHPRLAADFVDVRSLAVRYQARMTRKKNERQARWNQEKIDRAQKARRPVQDAPAWMKSSAPGAGALYRSWTSDPAQDVRRRVEHAWEVADKRTSTFLRTSRNKRDLRIRDQLKQVHLVNRFVEFWRLSPDRILEHRPDLVVSSDLPGLVGANIAARRLGVAHLHDCHELYLESTTLRPYEKTLLRPIEKTYMKRADAVVVVNETIRDEYEKRYGVRGTVLRNCAPAVADEVRSNPINLRALAGIPQDARVVLYQGGLAAGRGLDVCVRATADFPDDVHMVFIGAGRMLDELQSLAQEIGVTDRVHWLPAVEPAELPAYTAAADVGVIPYQPVSRNNRYALPNKVFEYTGAGIPFVASDLPELRRIVDTARCGEVYDPFDPAQLATAVRSVLAPERHPAYRHSAETFGRDNTWETEREILVTEVRRLTRKESGTGEQTG